MASRGFRHLSPATVKNRPVRWYDLITMEPDYTNDEFVLAIRDAKSLLSTLTPQEAYERLVENGHEHGYASLIVRAAVIILKDDVARATNR